MGSMCNRKPIVLDTKPRRHTMTKFSKLADFKKKYEYMSLLGNGAFGKVRLHRERASKNMHYAIKTIKKENLNKTLCEAIIEEVNILRDLDHPNIVKYYETYEDDVYIHLVMEYLQGDDLFKLIALKKYEHFSEKDAAEIITYLFKALNFIHNKHIIHRDVKPENILFSISGDYQSLKLIDFGLSTSNNRNRQSVGSPFYMAPEIIDGFYTYKTDIWSVGVILFIMMTGKFPFEGQKHHELFNKIKHENYNHKELKNKKCSEEVKDLIKKLLVKDQENRLSIEEALAHPWFKNTMNTQATTDRSHTLLDTGKLDKDILDSIKNFSFHNIFQKEILFYIAMISNDEEISHLRKVFIDLDIDNTGMLSYTKILEALKTLDLNIKQVNIQIL